MAMRKENGNSRESDSHRRVKKIFEEEQKLSKAFQLSNFYTNQRLNVAELKTRLEKFKRTQKQMPPSLHTKTPQKQKRYPPIFNRVLPKDLQTSPNDEDNSTAKFVENTDRKKKVANSEQKNKRHQTTMYEKTRQLRTEQAEMIADRFSPPPQNNKDMDAQGPQFRIGRQMVKSRYEPRNITTYEPRHIESADPIRNLTILNRILGKSRVQKGENSKCSNKSFNQSWEQIGLEGKIEIRSSAHLSSLEKQIQTLWNHYQLLTNILLGLRQNNKHDKNSIAKYVEETCSSKFEFVRELLGSLQKQYPSRSEAFFLKRMRKTVMLSKLYENLAIFHLSLQMCFKRQSDSNLVNFVGYCCSNVIFILRLVELSHFLGDEYEYSENTQKILLVIAEFEIASYKSRVQKLDNLVLRMEHNNQVLKRLQTRLCSKMPAQFQNEINKFLKKVQLQSLMLSQYAHYIFEFEAYYLARVNIVGEMSFIQMAPAPYLNLTKQKTLVIEPWGVLFAVREEHIYIRTYSQALLKEVAKYWNIVYWTDLMPDRIDNLIKKLPSGSVLYRYHCRFESGRFLKLLWRIGCDVENTIIIDREEQNFKYEKEMGMAIPWKGRRKDSKLLELLNAFQPLFSKDSISLKQMFSPVKKLFEKSVWKKQRGKIERQNNNRSRGQSLYPKRLVNR